MGTPSKLTSFLVCAVLLSTHGVARGDGFRIPYQGTAAAGQAEAFVAQADDASALYYNPAGLTQVQGFQIYVGSNFIGGHTSFVSPAGTSTNGDLGGSVVWPPPSHLYLTANLKDLGFDALGPLSVGIGVNSPYGLVIRWPNNGPFSTVVTEATLPLLDIKPTLAYKIHDMLSLGFGVDIYTFSSVFGEGHAELRSNSPVIPGMPPTEVNGTDTAAGFNVSALVTPWRNPGIDGKPGKPRMNFGVVYRSATGLDLGGSFLVAGTSVADAETRLKLPPVVGTGIAVWPIRDHAHEWKVEYDMEWIGWSAFNTLDFRFSNGASLSQPANWDDTYTLSLGTEYRWLMLPSLPHWQIALRGGYQRSQSPNPDTTFNPTIPDSNWNILSTGLGLKCTEGARFLGLISCDSADIVLDLAFSTAIWDSRTISGNIISPTINGTYETKDWYIGHVSIGLIY